VWQRRREQSLSTPQREPMWLSMRLSAFSSMILSCVVDPRPSAEQSLPYCHTQVHSPDPSLHCFRPPCIPSSQQQQAKAVPWTQQQALPTYTMYGAMGGGGGGALTKEEGKG